MIPALSSQSAMNYETFEWRPVSTTQKMIGVAVVAIGGFGAVAACASLPPIDGTIAALAIGGTALALSVAILELASIPTDAPMIYSPARPPRTFPIPTFVHIPYRPPVVFRRKPEVVRLPIFQPRPRDFFREGRVRVGGGHMSQGFLTPAPQANGLAGNRIRVGSRQ